MKLTCAGYWRWSAYSGGWTARAGFGCHDGGDSLSSGQAVSRGGNLSEPGRYMCGTAVNLVTRVIGTKERNGQPWYVLDDGMYGSYNGLVFDHWTYKLEFFQHGVKVPRFL